MIIFKQFLASTKFKKKNKRLKKIDANKNSHMSKKKTNRQWKMSLRCLTAWEQNLDPKSTDNWNWSKKCLRSFFFFEGRLIMHQFSGQIFQRTEFLMFLFPSHLFIALSSAISQLFRYIRELRLRNSMWLNQ